MADSRDRTTLIGVVILLVGLVLLADQFLGWSLSGALFGLVVLAIGGYLFAERWRDGRYGRLFLPALLVVFGALSALDSVVAWDAMAFFVPLVVVLVGVALLTRSWRRRQSGTPPTE